MSYEFYKIAHVVGILFFFASYGSLLVVPTPATAEGALAFPSRRSLMMLHGLSLLFVLVAGFGMLARLGIHSEWPGWVLAKVGIWLFLGLLPVLARRYPSWRWGLFVLAPTLGSLAAYLAVHKSI